MKAGKLAIWPWLLCQYNENTLVDLLSSVFEIQKMVFHSLDLNLSVLLFLLNMILLLPNLMEVVPISLVIMKGKILKIQMKKEGHITLVIQVSYHLYFLLINQLGSLLLINMHFLFKQIRND